MTVTTLPAAGRRATLALAVVAVLVLTGGCGSAGSPHLEAPPAVVEPSVIRTPDAATGGVPTAPQGRPLLTLTGRISTTNAGGALQLDQGELDRLGLLEMSVDDPWAKQRLALQGFWLRDLVDLAKPDGGATSLHLKALDDYQIDLSLADVRAEKIFLAVRDGDGAPLPIEEGGPTRVVFEDGLVSRFSPDMWIWNIDTIDVR